MLNAKLAIVEDEAPLREELLAFFKLKGMQVFGYATGEAFISALSTQVFDLVILDIGLPGLSGIEVADVLRKQSNTAILILTSHANHDTHLDSLNAGADVFLSKSAPLEIIESSLRNMLLRLQTTANTKQKVSDTVSTGQQRKADQATWRLFVKDGLLKAPNHLTCQLTFAETQFLRCLMAEGESAVSRSNILIAMNKDESLSNLRNLDTYATRIRRKVLEATSLELPIKSAYSLGYMFNGQAHVLP